MKLLDEIRLALDPDPGSYQAEWNRIEPFLRAHPKHRADILRGVWMGLGGYVATRVRAGMAYLTEYDPTSWDIVEQLAHSDDPDDRETALLMCTELQDPRGPTCVQHLLFDRWPYICFEAVEYLQDRDPQACTQALEALCNHELAWVRAHAKEALGRQSQTDS